MQPHLKKLLFIAYYFPPMGMGGIQRATKFVRYLPDFGWQPTIITVKDIHYYAKDFGLLSEVENRDIRRTGSLDPARLLYLFRRNRQTEQQVPARSSQLTLMNFFPFLTRYIFYPDSKKFWLPFAAHTIRKLLKKNQYQAVVSTAPPVSAHLLAAKTKLPWIADFRDYWTIGDGIYTPTRWHRRRYEKIMTTITQKAAKIITVSQPIADSIGALAPEALKHKIEVIPNGFDPNDFTGVKPIEFKNFTLVYTGNLNAQRSPENFLKAVQMIFEENPQFTGKLNCYFIGKHFDLEFPRIPLPLRDNVIFKDYMPHKESLAYTLGADGLVLILNSDSARGVVTGKVFEYLGTRKPILAVIPKDVAAYELLKNKPDCYFADPDDVRSIKQAILLLLKKHSKAGVKRLEPMPSYLNELTRRDQTRKLARLLEEVTGTS